MAPTLAPFPRLKQPRSGQAKIVSDFLLDGNTNHEHYYLQ
jgi:hypothetical protein